MNIPIDILLGWAIFWGAALFFLLRKLSLFRVTIIVLWVDLLFMPRLSPLISLGKDWLYGEAIVLLLGFIPGWLIAKSTAENTHVGWRAFAQAVMTGLLLVVLLPAALLEQFDRSVFEIFELSILGASLVINALILVFILGLAGNQEFAERGYGTPIPFDPPKFLVTTGPYAYLGNPMQLCIFITLIILSVAYESLAIGAASFVSVIYCLGVVRWHHTIDMEPRFGQAWADYRKNVPNWLPRWKPWIANTSTIFFARNCDICSDTETWLRNLKPVGLKFEDAANHKDSINRVTYRYPCGKEVSGIYAISSSMNHINLAFAFLGWFMRLPVVCHVLQIIIDGAGERAKVECKKTVL
jgi:protein-S-isoprenylcysteine O-methyltransferase Ste14